MSSTYTNGMVINKHTIEFFEQTDVLQTIDIDGDYLERLEPAQDALLAARSANIEDFNLDIATFIISNQRY